MFRSIRRWTVLGLIWMMAMLSGCGRKEQKVTDFHTEIFGENVYVFSPEDDPAAVQETLDRIYNVQETNQFGKPRYALYFLPGQYDESLEVNVGYYTQVAGLGKLPTDTKIPKLQTLARWLGDDHNHNATCNFWRSVENLEMQSNTTWAVSQATDMRRVQIDGALYLHDNYGWASGGFLANSRIGRGIDSGSQQQWLSRNNGYPMWLGENWNIVFLGDEPEGVPTATWPVKSYTKVEKTELVREKPFLVYDEKEGFEVFVPFWKENSAGTDWEGSETGGEILPLDKFYVATAEADSSASLNEALKLGKHLILTPGIYELEEPLEITNSGTIILGMGLATLTPAHGNECIRTSADDLILAGILFDAGTEESENLLYMAPVENAKPSQLSDVYFRVGGTSTKTACKVKACVTIDLDNVVGDNLWVWRADHGDQVAWDRNTAPNGIIINGDHARMYALMVEHFQEYQTVWNGNDGVCVMYQSEVPYDVPDAKNWKSHDGSVEGYSSFHVADDVEGFRGIGIGIYLYNRDAVAPVHSAMEIPDREGVSVHHIITVMLTGNPGMEHCINEAGDAVIYGGATSIIKDYENGEWK